MEKSLQSGHIPRRRFVDAVNEALGTTWPWTFESGMGADPVEPSVFGPLTRFWNGDDLRKMLETEWIEFDFADRILCLLDLVDLWYDELNDIYLEVNLNPVEEIAGEGERVKKCERGECKNTFRVRSGAGRPKKYCSNRCKQMARVRQAQTGKQRCAKRGCTNVFSPKGGGATAKRYCSDTCKTSAGARRIRGQRSRLNRATECPKGHLKTGENLKVWTHKSGQVEYRCRTCDLASKKATRERRKLKEAA